MGRTHWEAISREIGEAAWPKKINLRWIAKRDIHKGRKFDNIKSITDQASKEHAIKLTIESVEHELEHMKMSPVKYRDSMILKNLNRDLAIF